jgi:hypothetical protein
VLASGRQGRGLRLRAPVADRQEAPRARAARGLPPRRGQRGTATAYWLKEVRRRENELAAQGEQAYRRLVAAWQPKRPATRAWPPPTGRDSRGPQGAILRGRAQPRLALGCTDESEVPSVFAAYRFAAKLRR